MKNDRARRRRHLSPSRAVCETKKADVAGAKNIAKKPVVLETPPPFGSGSHLLVRVRVGEARALAHHGVRGGGGEPPRAPRLERVVLGVLVARRVVARQGAVVEHHSATVFLPRERKEVLYDDRRRGARTPPSARAIRGASRRARSSRGVRGRRARRDATQPRGSRSGACGARRCADPPKIYASITLALPDNVERRSGVMTCGSTNNGREGVRSFGFKRASSGRVRPVSSFKIGAGLKLNPRVRWKRPILSPPRRLRRCCLFIGPATRRTSRWSAVRGGSRSRARSSHTDPRGRRDGPGSVAVRGLTRRRETRPALDPGRLRERRARIEGPRRGRVVLASPPR